MFDGFILLILAAFFALFIFRFFLIKRKLFIFVYHVILFCILLVAAAGVSVLTDGYDRLEKFVELEKNGELEYAKQNQQNYDPMLVIDLNLRILMNL